MPEGGVCFVTRSLYAIGAPRCAVRPNWTPAIRLLHLRATERTRFLCSTKGGCKGTWNMSCDVLIKNVTGLSPRNQYRIRGVCSLTFYFESMRDNDYDVWLPPCAFSFNPTVFVETHNRRAIVWFGSMWLKKAINRYKGIFGTLFRDDHQHVINII